MNDAFPAPMRAWLERSPKGRRAITRLSADLDALVTRLESAIPSHIRDAITARIDPPRKDPAPIGGGSPPAAPRPGSGSPPPGLSG